MSTTPTPNATPAAPIHRFEVRTKPGLADPRARSVVRAAEAAGLRVERAASARVYLVQGNLTDQQAATLRDKLLTDPVTEQSAPGAAPPIFPGAAIVEVHPLPGVMDPAALSVRDAIAELLGGLSVQVSTGSRFDLAGITPEQAASFAQQRLANPVVQQITSGPWMPVALPRGGSYSLLVRHVPIRDLTDEQLTRLSRDAHLFLSLAEMKAVQEEYRSLGREPSDIELETIAQTWSEHCVHKTLKSRITYREAIDAQRPAPGYSKPAAPVRLNFEDRPGHTVNPDGSVTIDNLLKSTVAAATFELIEDGIDWTLSVFKDNSGIVELDDEHGVCIKVETHNHPSAIEPYGGAATGAGGCIRDVMGTGLGARPVANTDVFCVAFPGNWADAGSTGEAPAPCFPGVSTRGER